jgi:hypothetical protein
MITITKARRREWLAKWNKCVAPWRRSSANNAAPKVINNNVRMLLMPRRGGEGIASSTTAVTMGETLPTIRTNDAGASLVANKAARSMAEKNGVTLHHFTMSASEPTYMDRKQNVQAMSTTNIIWKATKQHGNGKLEMADLFSSVMAIEDAEKLAAAMATALSVL